MVDVLGQIGLAAGEGWERRILSFSARQSRVVDVNEAIWIAGNCMARHPKSVCLRVDAPDATAIQHPPSVAHVTGHLLAGPDAVLDSSANGAGPTMSLCLTVRPWLTFESPTLHHALESSINAETEDFNSINLNNSQASHLRLSSHVNIIADSEMRSVKLSSRRYRCLGRDKES